MGAHIEADLVSEALVQRRHLRVTYAGRAHLCVGGQMQVTPTPFRTYTAAALWHEADGLYVDQPARILRCLKLATSYIVMEMEDPHHLM
jgi:hypothetical protein